MEEQVPLAARLLVGLVCVVLAGTIGAVAVLLVGVRLAVVAADRAGDG